MVVLGCGGRRIGGRCSVCPPETSRRGGRRGEGGGVCVCVVGVLKADTVLVYVVMKMMQKNGEGAS